MLGVNCKSFIMDTPNTRSFQMGILFTNLRKTISSSEITIKKIDEVLNNDNLTDKYAKNILRKTRPTIKDTIEKINDKLYDETKDYDNIAKNCKNYFKRLDVNNNPQKIDKIKMDNLIENYNEKNIEKICAEEKKLNLILDNYPTHQSEFIEQIAKTLNINLIFLPPYSPDLNPIEDVWRVIKKHISNKFIKTGKEIVNFYITQFYEEVKNENLYKNWLKEFLNECIKS
ncbi:MAG: transposase [Methanobrevibacter sp.]|jgi:transposase|nr:transposase [Candidatus Methanoflexus mossambicus]